MQGIEKHSNFFRTHSSIVCSTPLLAPRIGLYTASLVSLEDALIGWSASDCDAPIQLWRIQINTEYTLPSPTWRASPTWRKQKAFPLPGTAALWVFWKSREFPAFFRGRGQSYARWHGTWNSLILLLWHANVQNQNDYTALLDELGLHSLGRHRLIGIGSPIINSLSPSDQKYDADAKHGVHIYGKKNAILQA